MGSLPVERVVDMRQAFNQFMLTLPIVHIARGDLEAARRAAAVFPDASSSDDVQESAAWWAGSAALSLAAGDPRGATDAAVRALNSREEIGLGSEAAKEALVIALESASQLGNDNETDRIIGIVDATPRGKLPQYVQAHTMRFRARLAERRGDLASAEELLKGAAGLFRELEVPFWTAVAEVELAERLSAWGRADEATPIVSDARAVFDRLKATPWLERADQIQTITAAAR
jgi:hypothetical protein